MNVHQRRLINRSSVKSRKEKTLKDSAIELSILTVIAYFFAWCFESGYFAALKLEQQLVKVDLIIFVQWLVSLIEPLIFAYIYYSIYKFVLSGLKYKKTIRYMALLSGMYFIGLGTYLNDFLSVWTTLLFISSIVLTIIFPSKIEAFNNAPLPSFIETNKLSIQFVAIIMSLFLGYIFACYGFIYGKGKSVYLVDRNNPNSIAIRVQGDRVLFMRFNPKLGQLERSAKFLSTTDVDLITSKTGRLEVADIVTSSPVKIKVK